MSTPKDLLIPVAVAAAAKYGLTPSLVCAIVERESEWNPWAIRYEPAFFNKYVLPAYSNNKYSITEAKSRSISWGLMQVMGEEAREFGFTGDLSSLCNPFMVLEVGCQIFAHKLKVNEGNVSKALQAWNGGANPRYADEVLALESHYVEPAASA